MPTPIDHVEAAIAGLKMPDDLAHVPPAQLRRLRDNCYVVQKACDQVLAQRVTEPAPRSPKSGILADLKTGRIEP